MSVLTAEKPRTVRRSTGAAILHAPTNGAFPPLESGDRLTRAEFERRYEGRREINKAELAE